MANKKYAIFKMKPNKLGVFEFNTMYVHFEATPDKEFATEFCKKLNRYKLEFDVFLKYEVFEIDEKNMSINQV